MLKTLREKFGGDKKALTNLTAVFALGVALIVFGNTLFKDGGAGRGAAMPQPQTLAQSAQNAGDAPGLSYEEQLEKRLKTVFENVEGAGRVAVMLTLSHGKETIIAEDSESQRSDTREKDSGGGEREQHSISASGTKIMIKDGDGVSRPLVLKEIEPQVEGVVIVAQGGDNIYIVDALVRATQTVLGVEAHKVQVLKMKD